MEITAKYRNRIEEIIEGMRIKGEKCTKDFECYRSSFEKLCKIKGVGTFDEIECKSEDTRCCGESFDAVSKHFCICPLRRYISINFHK